MYSKSFARAGEENRLQNCVQSNSDQFC